MQDERITAALELLALDRDEEALRRELEAGLRARRGASGVQLLRAMERAGGRLLGLDQELPARLRDMGSMGPAPLITTTAPDRAFHHPAVAVVGTRRSSAAGLELAHNLGAYLARAGVVVVSGLARGIDGAAHRGVVAEGGVGIAVLGSGIDVVYPRGHVALASDLERLGGGLVSQYAPGAQPLPWHFPRRNRVIAALADAVVVVESHAAGGALITADYAASIGREVLAVPGSPFVPAAVGCLGLIADGATVLRAFEDVLLAIGLEAREAPPLWRAEDQQDPLARRILELLTPDPVTVDALVRLVRRDARDVARAISRLELAGSVARERGGVRLRMPQRAMRK